MTNDASSTFLLLVATSTLDNARPFKGQRCHYAWRIVTDGGISIARDSNPFGGDDGDHTKAVYPAIREGLSKLPESCRVIVITSLSYVRDQLNTPYAERRHNGYRKSNGKPLADKADLVALDDELERRCISISGRTASGEVEETLLENLQTWAKEKARNDGADPSDWNL